MNKKSHLIWIIISAPIILAVVLMNSRKTDINTTSEKPLITSNSVLVEKTLKSREPSVPNATEQNTPTIVGSDTLKYINATTLNKISNTPDLKERPSMLYDLMVAASLEEVKDLLTSSDDPTYSVGFRDAMKIAAYERWYVLDPSTAIRQADASSMTQNQKIIQLQVYLDDWASKSPKEVMHFIQQETLSDLSPDHIFGAIVRGSAASGDREVIDFALQKMTDPKYRKYAIQAAATSLRQDHEALFEDWLAQLSVEEQHIAIAESAKVLVDTDIDRAIDDLKFLAKSESKQLAVAASRVVVKWTEKDPVAAAEWVQDFKGEQREALFANVINVWLLADENAALDWIGASIKKGVIDEAFIERVAAKM